jgi:predicted ATPase
VLVHADEMLRVGVQMQMPGIQRPLEASELSDGTLRYLCLVAALLTPRPPELLALNEPETSLHPQLLEPLGRLIARASRSSQMFVTTHSRELADAIGNSADGRTIELALVDGETRVAGQRLDEDDDEVDSPEPG